MTLPYVPKMSRVTEGRRLLAEVRKMNIDGTERQVIELPFEIRREHWAEYEFADGGGVRFKAAVTRIWQVLDDAGQPDRLENGDLSLAIESTNLVVSDTS